MTLDRIFGQIDRYLSRQSGGRALVVDVQNGADLEALVQRYRVPGNVFVSGAEFCTSDTMPQVVSLYDRLVRDEGRIFIHGLLPFLMLRGKLEVRASLSELLSMNIAGHSVIISWQCREILEHLVRNDLRLRGRVCIAGGEAARKPVLTFIAPGLPMAGSPIVGFDKFAAAVEKGQDEIVIETTVVKASFPRSMYAIEELKSPFDILHRLDSSTEALSESLGTEEQWKEVLSDFSRYKSWEGLVSSKFCDCRHLENEAENALRGGDKNRLWLYFIALKLFGAGKDWCLAHAKWKAENVDDFVTEIFCGFLDLDPKDGQFPSVYKRRRELLRSLGNMPAETSRFCNRARAKGRDALYYLTDGTRQERELAFQLLSNYGAEYGREELAEILKVVYPDLAAYLAPFNFGNDFLNGYFQDYKYQKVVNTILPEFEATVRQQALNRDFYALPTRASIVEKIDRDGAQVYFADAMGVEYLGFIMETCREMKLLARVVVCRCELPSITSRNREFCDFFESYGVPVKKFSDIDEIKHQGVDGFDFSKTKLPSHLGYELAAVRKLLEHVSVSLQSGEFRRAVLISDHGASRLAVISELEHIHEMIAKGQHSGRCCPKSELDAQPEYAVDADDFWALANYDRFRGGRRADVEVHGGATLEEVAVPVIEITLLPGSLDVQIMPADTTAPPTDMPKIIIDRKKPARLKVYLSQMLDDVSVSLRGHEYPARRDGDFYMVDLMPEVHRVKSDVYGVNVYAAGNLIAEGLKLKIEKKIAEERDLLS